MTLYHGTNTHFEAIDLKKSCLGKDFGTGFYLTPDLNVAKRQSERKFERSGEGTPIVLKYLWDELSAQKLNVKRFEHYSLEWAEFILANRNNRTCNSLHNYDIVIGPIADDTVGFQIRRFEDGVITMPQFLEEIKFNRVTIQYLFATGKAIKTLTRI